MRDIWFTSDFHFGHFNIIIRYCDALLRTHRARILLGRAEQVLAYRTRIAVRRFTLLKAIATRLRESNSICLPGTFLGKAGQTERATDIQETDESQDRQRPAS